MIPEDTSVMLSSGFHLVHGQGMLTVIAHIIADLSTNCGYVPAIVLDHNDTRAHIENFYARSCEKFSINNKEQIVFYDDIKNAIDVQTTRADKTLIVVASSNQNDEFFYDLRQRFTFMLNVIVFQSPRRAAHSFDYIWNTSWVNKKLQVTNSKNRDGIFGCTFELQSLTLEQPQK